jgi:7-cyano-7-deazaguanine reductase
VAACQPRWMQVEGEFFVRGGIYTTVSVEHHGKPRKAKIKRKK